MMIVPLFLVAASTTSIVSGFIASPHAKTCKVAPLPALKANSPNERPRQRPKAKKTPIRRIDPALAMVPVPLMPDVNGNWEALVSDLWLDIENMCKLSELKHPDADFSRFRKFCDNYRTQRGLLTSPNGRIVSAQTRLLDIEDDAPVVWNVAEKFKFTKRLADRIVPSLLGELDAATEDGKLNASWSRDVIMAVRDELWDGPPKPREDDDDEQPADDKPAALSSSQTTASAAAATTTADSAATATTKPATTTDADAAVEAPAPPPPPPLSEAWSQLLLHQASPMGTGVLRFPRTMRILDKYKAMRPLPRNVIIGRLPPGKKTEARSDLHNFALTVQIPLRGCAGQSGVIVGGQKVPWNDGEPVVFDPSVSYSMYNDGPEDALVFHVDFWHPDVTIDERQMLAYFWMLWQQDKYHPSTRSKFTRRVNFRKELARKEREERRKKLKRNNDKKEGGGGGSIARK